MNIWLQKSASVPSLSRYDHFLFFIIWLKNRSQIRYRIFQLRSPQRGGRPEQRLTPRAAPEDASLRTTRTDFGPAAYPAQPESQLPPPTALWREPPSQLHGQP